MSQIHLSQRLPLIGIVKTISVLTIIGTILTPGVEDTAQASTFREAFFDTGALIGEAQGPVRIPLIDKIRGEFSPTDIDLYQLQIESDSALNVNIRLKNLANGSGPLPGLDILRSISPLASDSFALDLIDLPTVVPPPISERKLFLFDQIGKGLASDLDQLSFIGQPGEIFYLGVNGTIPLDENGAEIFDAATNSPIRGRGILTSWVDPGIGIGIAQVYEVSLTTTPLTVPDPSFTTGLLSLGIIGAVSNCQGKLNFFKFKQSKLSKNPRG